MKIDIKSGINHISYAHRRKELSYNGSFKEERVDSGK